MHVCIHTNLPQTFYYHCFRFCHISYIDHANKEVCTSSTGVRGVYNDNIARKNTAVTSMASVTTLDKHPQRANRPTEDIVRFICSAWFNGHCPVPEYFYQLHRIGHFGTMEYTPRGKPFITSSIFVVQNPLKFSTFCRICLCSLNDILGLDKICCYWGLLGHSGGLCGKHNNTSNWPTHLTPWVKISLEARF